MTGQDKDFDPMRKEDKKKMRNEVHSEEQEKKEKCSTRKKKCLTK